MPDSDFPFIKFEDWFNETDRDHMQALEEYDICGKWSDWFWRKMQKENVAVSTLGIVEINIKLSRLYVLDFLKKAIEREVKAYKTLQGDKSCLI